MTTDTMKHTKITVNDVALIPFTEELEKEIYGDKNPYENGGHILLKDWCELNDAYYYADLKEDFSIDTAIREAKRRGCDSVLLDNLS